MEGRVTGRTTSVGSGVFDAQSVGDLFGTGGGESGERALGMEIAQGPGEKLVLVATGAAVAAGAGTGTCAQVFRGRSQGRFCTMETAWQRQEKKESDGHGKSEALDFATGGFTRHGGFDIQVRP
jgi:hypothetical protein